MTAARVQDLAIGAGVTVLALVVLSMAGFTIWQAFDEERARRARARYAPLVASDVPRGVTGGGLAGTPSALPAAAPSAFVEDEIAQTARRVIEGL